MSRLEEISKKIEEFAKKAETEVKEFTNEARKTILEEKFELEKNKTFKEYAKKIYENKKQNKSINVLIENMIYEIDGINIKINKIKREN
jgi:predicted outer membrane protein